MKGHWLTSSAKPLQIVFTSVLVFFTGLVMVGTWQLQKWHIEREVHSDLLKFNHLFQGVLKHEAVLLESLLDRYKDNSDFQKAFLAGDREGLFDLAIKDFTDIKTRYQITHFYFHNLDKTCFLRVHNPSLHGDVIERFTLAHTAMTGKSAFGVELGPLGTFTLRFVRPWLIDGKVTGYLELGKEIEHLSNYLRLVMNDELIFLIDKPLLERSQWEEGIKMLDRHGDWDLLPGKVIIDSSLKNIPSEISSDLVKYISKPEHRQKLFRIVIDKKHFCGGTYQLVEAGGREVGCIVVMKDITDHIKITWIINLSIFVLTLFLVFISYGFFFTYMSKLEKEIRISTSARDITYSILNLSFESLSLQQLLQHSLELIIKPSFVVESKGAIFLVEKKSQSLIMQAHYGLSEELLKRCSRIPFGLCLCGEVARKEKMIFVDSITDDHHIRYSGIPEHGHYCLPIISSERLLGVLNLYVPVGHEQNSFEIEYLQMISKTLAAVIERKMIEEDQRLFRTLLDAAHDTVLVIDPETGGLLDVNEASLENLGYERDELLDLKIADIEKVLSVRKEWKMRVAKLRERKSMIQEGLYQRKDGSNYPVEVNMRLVLVEGRQFIVTVARDISERKQIEMERLDHSDHLEKLVEQRTQLLKKVERELARQEKLAAIGKLAATVRHDLRNPLGVISNAVYFLKMKLTKADDNILYYLDLLQEQVDRSDNIIGELLDFSKELSLEQQTISINDLLASTLETSVLPAHIRLETSFAEDLPEIYIDPHYMQRVFQNLIINSIQAMSDKGCLTIETHRGEDFIEVVVKDTGCGINKDDLPMIFDPLFTTKPQGIGLGLSIVNDIVKQHGGQVFVESEVGKGTIFTVRLASN